MTGPFDKFFLHVTPVEKSISIERCAFTAAVFDQLALLVGDRAGHGLQKSVVIVALRRWTRCDHSSIFGLYANRFDLYRGHHVAKPESARMAFGLRSSFSFSKVIL